MGVIIWIPILFYFLVMPIQEALSGTKNKYIGLILPAITFIISIYAVINNKYIPQSLLLTIREIITCFTFFNIPTFIFYSIYKKERKIYDNTWYNKSGDENNQI